MTTSLRITKQYTIYKSLAGLGISIVRHRDGENSLWDASFDNEHDITYLVGCDEEECNNYITKQITF